MTEKSAMNPSAHEARENRFATLTFEREVSAPLNTLWQSWTDPAARAIWAAPSPEVTVEFTEADTRIGGREVSLCKVAGQPDIRCDVGWLELQPNLCSINYEVISTESATQSVSLITADFSGTNTQSRILVTIQLSSQAADMAAGYQQGFDAGLDNLTNVAKRTMMIERVIQAPCSAVWKTWMNADTLPQWWGPDGFSCQTKRIDLRTGGEWVFDMITPDGANYPNHHRYHDIQTENRISYSLLWGEDGPKHADAWVLFEDQGGATKVTLCMTLINETEFRQAKDMGAVELGQQTLGKLEQMVLAE